MAVDADRDADVAAPGWRVNLAGDGGLEGPRPASWWTGPRPVRGECPGVGEDGVLRALPLPDPTRCGTAGALAYFENGWALTETLFSALQGEEAFYRPPWHGLRHPLVFYYCHPATLYVNKARVAGLLDGPLDADFERLFETGVDEMSWDDLSKNALRWPRVAEVTEYRRRVFDAVRDAIERDRDIAAGTVDPSRPAWALFMGFEHERIHLETSSVLVRELPVRLLRRPEAWPPLHPSVPRTAPPVPVEGRDFPAPAWVELPGGEVVAGKPATVATYGWDNESGERRVPVRPFAAGRTVVSNGEFHRFVASGAYADPRWWGEEGWRWRTFRNARWPAFWVGDGPAGLHRYRLRTLFETVPMPWSWPVVVNHHEARAYAAWRAAGDGADRPYRLLTEGEHHHLRGPAPAPDAPLGERDPVTGLDGAGFAARGINLGLAHGSEGPVDAGPAAPSGAKGVVGNVWQWAEDHFAPLPGFRVHRLYEDFSTPCFDGEHKLILGGSFASAGDEASVFARFHFRRHFHQHAGFRLVRPDPAEDRPETTCLDAPPPRVGAGPCCSRSAAGGRGTPAGYEARSTLDAYLLMHYGSAGETLGEAPGPREALAFPARCARVLADAAARLGVPTGRALDVGCAVGGASFALARTYGAVTGIDLSASFIEAALALAAGGRLEYRRVDEGERTTRLVAAVDPAVDRSRVRFRRGDACALPADLEPFDAVLLANLLCRLPSPRACLDRMGGARGLVKPGGLLLVVSPFTWREDYTPRDAWLGGFERDGAPVRSEDGLRAELEGEFDPVDAFDMPFLLREHARKFEYVVSRATLWRRKPAGGAAAPAGS